LRTLKKSIEEIGLLHPVVLDEDNNLIAGARRIQAFKELGKDIIPVHVIPLKNLIKGELHENLIRADFTEKELVLIRKELRKEERRGKPAESAGFSGETRDVVAKMGNMGHNTLDKLEFIYDNDPQQLDKKSSVNYRFKEVKRAEDKKNMPPLPAGEYNIILADPPWQYDINTRGSPDDHYNVMSQAQIERLDVPASENCVLFLWATAPKLQEALDVMGEWGFEYKTNMVWVKDKIGTGYYFRGKHEFLLVGVKGNPLIPEESDRPESVLVAPRTEHSKKPQQIYNIIERMYPMSKYLELFARETKQGWTSWGNEIANMV